MQVTASGFGHFFKGFDQCLVSGTPGSIMRSRLVGAMQRTGFAFPQSAGVRIFPERDHTDGRAAD
jgi:hypothetical protein